MQKNEMISKRVQMPFRAAADLMFIKYKSYQGGLLSRAYRKAGEVLMKWRGLDSLGTPSVLPAVYKEFSYKGWLNWSESILKSDNLN